MINRESLRNEFIEQLSFKEKHIHQIQGDLSNKSYFRLTNQKDSFILMDWPTDKDSFQAFIKICNFLLENEFSAPRLFEIDAVNGFILMEDFGQYKIGDILKDKLNLPDEADEEKIYRRALDVLSKLHKTQPMDNLQIMSEEEYIKSSSRFIDWYADVINGEPISNSLKNEFTQIMSYLLNKAKTFTPVMMLRDYHVDNLFWLPDRSGIQKVGLIDFQDAKIASPVYDIVSILEDARRDISPELSSKMISHYLKSFPNYDRKDFMTNFHILGAQRNLGIIGNFAHKATKEKRSHLLTLLPRVLGYLRNDLKHPILLPLKEWMERAVPQKEVVSALTYGSGNTKVVI